MKGKLIEYFKLVRLPGWGAYCVPAVFGALSVGVFDIYKIALIFIIGGFATIYGFVMNDYADVVTDKLSKDLLDRPLVKGTIPRKNALFIVILSAVFAYLIIFIAMYKEFFILSYKPLLYLGIAAILTAIYNFYGKKILGSDIFVAAATSLYCLFGASLVSNQITNLTWIIVIVTFIQVFYLNAVIGGIKDADHDYKTGTKNISYRMGVRADKEVIIPISFKIFSLLLRFGSAFFLFVPIFYFQDFKYQLWQPILMALMFLGVFISTVKMLEIKAFDRNQLRKLFSIQAFLRYSIVPVMLLVYVGYPIGLFLIFFPFVWYAIFNRMIYGKAIQPGTL